MAERTIKRVRPYTKHIPLGKNCQACGKPIFAMRLDRAASAIACSRACLGILLGKRLRERPPRKGKFHVKNYVSTGGYVFVNINRLESPVREWAHSTIKGNYLQEHRVVMMRMLGRPLLRRESVHHKDGNKQNNAPENLELWLGSHGNGQRASDVTCPHCGKEYAPNG